MAAPALALLKNADGYEDVVKSSVFAGGCSTAEQDSFGAQIPGFFIAAKVLFTSGIVVKCMGSPFNEHANSTVFCCFSVYLFGCLYL